MIPWSLRISLLCLIPYYRWGQLDPRKLANPITETTICSDNFLEALDVFSERLIEPAHVNQAAAALIQIPREYPWLHRAVQNVFLGILICGYAPPYCRLTVTASLRTLCTTAL